MPKDILPFEVPIHLFTWNTPERKLVAFVSDLPNEPFRRVWADACDVGLKVKGRRETKLFTLADEERRGSEIVAWNLSEYRGKWKMVVFND